MPAYKYDTLHGQVPDSEKPCPPRQANEAERVGFHFVFVPVDARSFEVFAPRKNRFGENGCCSDCAVSMFETEEQARAAFAKYERDFKNFRIRNGDHLGEIALKKNHGVQTDSDEEGHFDLHEYAGVDLIPLVVLRGQL